MEKLDKGSQDINKQNIEIIKELFPNIVSDGKINFDILKEDLGEEVDEGREKYEFNWKGKALSIKNAQTPSLSTLRPCKAKSKNWNDTKNLYIEGDNLEILKQLQKTYHEKIKLIYIDPPYNTGKDFVYSDKFDDSINNYLKQTSQKSSNPETDGRFHTNWLNMIYPRLILARNLLTYDGAIFISIDDNEVTNARRICDEIFGESCFIANICWQKVYSPKNNKDGISTEAEYVLCYSKSDRWLPGKLERTEEMNRIYKNPDGDPRGDWTSSDACAPGAITHQGMVYAIQNPFTGKYIYPTRGRCWSKFQPDLFEIMNHWCSYKYQDIHDEKARAAVCGIDEEKVRKDVKAIVLAESLEESRKKANTVLKNKVWPDWYFTDNGMGGIRKKTFLIDMEGRSATNLWPYTEVGHTDGAKKALGSLFDGALPFDTPKPVQLLQRILKIASDKSSIVLDFFSGSGTMAEAVLKANAEDGGNRQFILAQLPEKSDFPGYKTICDIGEERIRRAGEQIKKEWEEKYKADGMFASDEEFPVDIGFKVFTLDSTNIKAWDNEHPMDEDAMMNFSEYVFKDGRSDEDVLYEIMLKYGVFDQPASAITVNGKTMYRVGKRHMIVCLSNKITDADVKAIRELHPRVVIFKEAGFGNDDNAKINAIYNLQKADVEDVKSI